MGQVYSSESSEQAERNRADQDVGGPEAIENTTAMESPRTSATAKDHFLLSTHTANGAPHTMKRAINPARFTPAYGGMHRGRPWRPELHHHRRDARVFEESSLSSTRPR